MKQGEEEKNEKYESMLAAENAELEKEVAEMMKEIEMIN